MADVLEKMELVEQNIKLLGEEGAIPPLVEMASGTLESKKRAFAALAKLASCHENKKLIAGTDVVPRILEHTFTSHMPGLIRASCSKILERLCSVDGIEFLVDGNGDHLELEPIITNLLALQQNPNFGNDIRRPALCALLDIYKSGEASVQKAVAGADGVSIILPLLEDPDHEIRQVVVNLLFHFSQQEPQGIAEFLLVGRRLEAFVAILEDENHRDLQMAAVGLLSHLPKSEVELTERLIKLEGLQAIFTILRLGTVEAKENALSTLFRFTDPGNIELQRMVVELGAYPLLISFLKSGSATAKARAAALIGNLSSSTPKLVVPPKTTGCSCFRPSRVSVCEVHGGICNVTTTFCLYKASALPELVKLLQERVHATAYEALQALATLVQECPSYRGANVLHEADAICPMLELLDWGTPPLKEEALGILEKVFAAKELGDLYCSQARIPLVNLTTQSQEGEQLGRKASRVLGLIDRYSRSMPLV